MPMIMSPYFPLFAIVVFAFLIPILSDRIGIPAVVGEIICGIIIGRSVLGLFTGEEEGIAFLAGVILSILFHGGTVLEQKLYGIGYGFLIPIFFINVGMQFDLWALARGGIYLVPMLLLIAFVVKMVPSLFLLINYSLKHWNKKKE